MRKDVVINPKYALQVRELVQNLADGELPDGEVVYHGRNTIYRVKVDGLDLAIKSFDKLSLPNRYIYGHMRKSKAQRSYENASRLAEMGIGTPEPVAYIDTYKGGRLVHSYYICLFCDDPTIEHWVDWSNAADVPEALAKFMINLHEKGIWQRDFNANNILMDDNRRCYLVDLNRMKFGVHDMKKFMTNFMHVSHRREDIPVIAEVYARLRGFDAPKRFGQEAVEAFDRFYRHRRIKRRIKHPIRALKGEDMN